LFEKLQKIFSTSTLEYFCFHGFSYLLLIYNRISRFIRGD